MPSLRDSIGRFLPTSSPSVRLFVEAGGGTSVREAIWHHKLRAINQLFLGSTSEEEEDQALALMLSAESGDEMAFLINNVTWDGLDDDLDEPDLDQILRHASLLLERRDFIAIRFLRRAFGVDPGRCRRSRSAISPPAQPACRGISGSRSRTRSSRDAMRCSTAWR